MWANPRVEFISLPPPPKYWWSGLPKGSSGGYKTTTKVILSFLSFSDFFKNEPVLGAIPFRNLSPFYQEVTSSTQECSRRTQLVFPTNGFT
jgi:hypothetical protein